MPELESPDHSFCQHCDKPIYWSDWCYVHNDTGFAECGILISGGQRIGWGAILNPVVLRTEGVTTHAEPVEWRRV